MKKLLRIQCEEIELENVTEMLRNNGNRMKRSNALGRRVLYRERIERWRNGI